MASRVEHFQQLVTQQPQNVLFRFSLAQALTAESRLPEAVPHLEVCVASKADWMMPRILLGKALLQRGQPAEARPLLEDALRLSIEQQQDDPERELRALLAEF